MKMPILFTLLILSTTFLMAAEDADKRAPIKEESKELDPKNGGSRGGKSVDDKTDPKNGGSRGGKSVDDKTDPKNGGSRGGKTIDDKTDPKNGGSRGGVTDDKREKFDQLLLKRAKGEEISPEDLLDLLFHRALKVSQVDCSKLIKVQNFDLNQIDKLNFLMEQVLKCNNDGAYHKNNDFEAFINRFQYFLTTKLNSTNDEDKRNCSQLDKDSIEYLRSIELKQSNSSLDLN